MRSISAWSCISRAISAEIGEPRLELGKRAAPRLGHDLIHAHIRQRRVDIDEVARLGPVLQPRDLRRQRLGVGLGLADLLRNRVGIVGQVDPAHIRGIGFRHLLAAIAQAHHPRRRPLDHRLGQRKELYPVIVVELHGNVARKLDMLFLVLAYRHMGGVIGEDIGGHQRGIGEEAQRGVLRVLARLVLELRHALHPAHARHAVEHPGQLAVLGHL
jgi:hypothetical protein